MSGMYREPESADSLLHGLSPQEVEKSRAEHGSNRLREIRGKSWWQIWKRSLDDRTLKILIGAAAVVLAVDVIKGGDFIEGFAILTAVAIASLVSTWNEWRAQAEFKSLQIEREALNVHVRRDGKVQIISSFDLVVGDVIEIEVGQKIPADGILAAGSDVEVDESMLTGESEPVSVSEQGPLRAGTIVTRGRGAMVVTAVGERTEYGLLRAQLDVEQDPTPLQQRLGKLADRIGLFGLGAAVVIFLTLTGTLMFSGGLSLDLHGARQLLVHAVLAVTIVVVAVPEGLPLAVTISLAYSVMRMARDKSLVRRLMACETMGAAEVICADKTGTLTLNRMRVERLLFADVRLDDVASTRAEELPLWGRELFTEIAAVNSTAHIDRSSSEVRYIGSPTEGALLELVESWGESYEQQRRRACIQSVLAFSSERKCMSTLVERPDGTRLLCKGAAEFVLERCTSILDRAGPKILADGDREFLVNVLEEWSAQALRPLALAYRSVREVSGDQAGLEQDLTLVALVGIGDPIRDEVPQAVDNCHRAGVEVKIVTGDARLTAEAVARRVGVLRPDDLVLEGDELREVSDEDLEDMLPRLRLVARAVPSDKLRLVRALKKHGQVVAVTGDGTNDGPALRHADVGMSMGLSGTDVAREASDIVILDDNFASVVKAVHWGRTIFANIRSFLQFQLTVSLVALATAFIAALGGLGTPLGVVQLLWVNLIMDTLAALALSLDDPSQRSASSRPHGRTEPIVNAAMWTNILGIGSVMLLVLLIALFSGVLAAPGDPEHFTAVFNLFVLMQVANMFNSRAIGFQGRIAEGLKSARLFWVVVFLILIAQVMIVQFGGGFFKTVPLGTSHWMLCVLLASAVIPAGALVRILGRRMSSRSKRHLAEKLYDPSVRFLLSAWNWANQHTTDSVRVFLAPAGVLTAVAGLALRSLGPRWSGWGYALFSAGVAAFACWAWEQYGRRPWRRWGYRSSIRLHAALAGLLALGLVAQCNYISSRHFRRFDLTATRRFTLSPQTGSVLARLDHPVRFTTIFRAGALATDVSDLLAEYKAAGRYIEIEHVDPDRDPGEVERLGDRLGLKSPGLSSVVVEYRGRHRLLPWQELVSRKYEYKKGRRLLVRGAPPVFRGEEALTSALIALTIEEPIRICFLSGHGERNFNDFGSEGMAMARDILRREGYQTAAARLVGGNAISPDCRVLIQAGPRHHLSAKDVRAISAYLAAGGKWLVTLEPWQFGGLDSLLKEWGIEARQVFLSDPGSSVAGVGPTTLVASRYQDHAVTAGLSGMPLVFPYATSVRIVQGKKTLEGANLVLTSKKGIGETDRHSRVARFDAGRDIKSSLSVASAVSEPQNLYLADGRREPARVIAVGDTDFASNAHIHRGANRDFFINAVDWLARREELIGVRARPAEQRRISLSAGGQSAIYWTVMGFVPGLVGVFGAIVAWRRRK